LYLIFTFFLYSFSAYKNFWVYIRLIIIVIIVHPEYTAGGNHLAGVIITAEEAVVVGVQKDVG